MFTTRFTKLALAAILTISTSTTTTTNALLTNPIRTVINRDIKTPDPVPQAGIDEAVSLMSTGRMYRYNVPDAESSVVSQCEVEIAKYTGHKYCVALNSCGSAIMLMMKCAGLEAGDEVLSNAFTFGAVPSAIEHAGGKVCCLFVLIMFVVLLCCCALWCLSYSPPTSPNIKTTKTGRLR